jgi:hypothetical protein
MRRSGGSGLRTPFAADGRSPPRGGARIEGTRRAVADDGPRGRYEGSDASDSSVAATARAASSPFFTKCSV